MTKEIIQIAGGGETNLYALTKDNKVYKYMPYSRQWEELPVIEDKNIYKSTKVVKGK